MTLAEASQKVQRFRYNCIGGRLPFTKTLRLYTCKTVTFCQCLVCRGGDGKLNAGLHVGPINTCFAWEETLSLKCFYTCGKWEKKVDDDTTQGWTLVRVQFFKKVTLWVSFDPFYCQGAISNPRNQNLACIDPDLMCSVQAALFGVNRHHRFLFIGAHFTTNDSTLPRSQLPPPLNCFIKTRTKSCDFLTYPHLIVDKWPRGDPCILSRGITKVRPVRFLWRRVRTRICNQNQSL